MSHFSLVKMFPKDFYTNNDLPDWEIVNVFNGLCEQAENEGLELETDDDGGFLLSLKDSKKSDVYRCCQNLREVEVFLEGVFVAREIAGNPTLSNYQC